MQTQPSLAGNGAGAELGNWSQIAFKNKHWITKYFIEEKYEHSTWVGWGGGRVHVQIGFFLVNVSRYLNSSSV